MPPAKPVLYSKFDASALEFKAPVRDNTGISVPVHSGGAKVQIQLPKLK